MLRNLSSRSWVGATWIVLGGALALAGDRPKAGLHIASCTSPPLLFSFDVNDGPPVTMNFPTGELPTWEWDASRGLFTRALMDGEETIEFDLDEEQSGTYTWSDPIGVAQTGNTHW